MLHTYVCCESPLSLLYVLRSICRTKHDWLFCCCAQIRDDAGTEISSKICHIIGSDCGSLPYATDHPWPSTGMMTDVAYRWDVVCDFSAYTGRVRPWLLC